MNITFLAIRELISNTYFFFIGTGSCIHIDLSLKTELFSFRDAVSGKKECCSSSVCSVVIIKMFVPVTLRDGEIFSCQQLDQSYSLLQTVNLQLK